MSTITGDGILDGEALEDGAALELRLTGDRWIPVRWKAGTVVLELGGDFEHEQTIEAALAIDFSRAEFRRGAPVVRTTRVMALDQFVREHAPEVPLEMPDLGVVRAQKQIDAELPKLIAEYHERFRAHGYDLFRAAARFGAARGTADENQLADARAALEQAALAFEESSRWLAALQMMEADSKE
jgi:hypothetical protein